MQDIKINHINICLDKIADDHLTLSAYKFADACQEKGIDVVFCVLNKSTSKYSKDYCFFDMADKYSDSGIYIATSTNTAHYLSKMCGKNLNVFYMWDLEWTKKENFIYEDNISKYKLDNFNYWSTSEDRSKIIKHVWNIDSNIIKDFNYEQVISKLKEIILSEKSI
jgi:hypothetical protein